MISVLTPTYNRAYTLTRLYDSLLKQVTKEFEWVVIDDGSEDETDKLITGFQEQNLVNIIYVKQKNMGKPQALNSGVKHCSGNYILIVDSDDALTEDAIYSLNESIKIADQDNKEISGVCFRRAYFNNEIIGNHFNDTKNSTCYLHSTDAGHYFNGDLAYCFKKTMMLAHPFPYFLGEKFVPELFIWNKISDQAPVKFHKSKAIYLSEYLDDGLSKNFHLQLKANPKGFGLYYKDQFNREVKIIKKIKMLVRYFQCRIYEFIK